MNALDFHGLFESTQLDPSNRVYFLRDGFDWELSIAVRTFAEGTAGVKRYLVELEGLRQKKDGFVDFSRSQGFRLVDLYGEPVEGLSPDKTFYGEYTVEDFAARLFNAFGFSLGTESSTECPDSKI